MNGVNDMSGVNDINEVYDMRGTHDDDRSPAFTPAPDDVVWDLPGEGEQRVSLLVLPHAGGNAHAYAEWRAYLPADVRLLIGQYPGRGARFAEDLPRDVADLAGPVVAALPAGATDELVVLGHSMGSLVAFEVVRALQAAGRTRGRWSRRPAGRRSSPTRPPCTPNSWTTTPWWPPSSSAVAPTTESSTSRSSGRSSCRPSGPTSRSTTCTAARRRRPGWTAR